MSARHARTLSPTSPSPPSSSSGTLEMNSCKEFCQTDSEANRALYNDNIVQRPAMLLDEDSNPPRWTTLKSDVSEEASPRVCAVGSRETCWGSLQRILRFLRWTTQRWKCAAARGTDRCQSDCAERQTRPKLCNRRRGKSPPCPSPFLTALLVVTLLSTSVVSRAARARARARGGSSAAKRHGVQELRCPPCRQIHCAIKDPKLLGCKGGVTTGVCGCCPACARLTGQSCGGDLAYLGKCDRGLSCRPAPSPSTLPVYRTQREPPGICTKDTVRRTTEQADEAFTHQCRPRCTQHFCSRRPRAVCSASKGIAEVAHPCQGSCQHTSCRACAVVDDIECVRCTGQDFRCLKQFGRCVARQRCRGKAGRKLCKRLRIKGNIGRRFVCKVPECPS